MTEIRFNIPPETWARGVDEIYDLLAGAGFEIADDPIAENVFWGRQLEAVLTWWRRDQR